ncbi:BTB/POZ protein [Radiomyces spectabilis]|uniref:BTB/POZ protein n=1 Tax=Radiomyces spectabilis TaxID=64574 RepID=UPI00221E8B98|nr:BTB/POZ protein [Radiomyces spectabilis]KAI8366717.1 BTB/POZ protein [Radiomyces spectabilis]
MTKEFHGKVERAYIQMSKEQEQGEQALREDENTYQREKQLIYQVKKHQSEKVRLNVGGQYFETSLSTLRRDPNSMLAAMFSESRTLVPDVDGSYFIDRDSTYFRLVLNYLRDLKIPASVKEDPKILDELMQEARFYRLNDLLKTRWMDLPKISQEELNAYYHRQESLDKSQNVIFRFEKKDLSGLDFSNFRIDPRSSFADSNLENATFVNAVFSFDFEHQTNFRNAYLVNTRFPEPGSSQRAPGIEFDLEGAFL